MNWDLNNTFIRSASPKFSDEDLSEETAVPAETNGNSAREPIIRSQEQRPPYPAMEEDFKKMGRNTFAFWVLLIMLFALTLGNLALTISVLRLRGVDYLELVPEADTIKFFGDVDLDRIQKRDGVLEGFGDIPMTIEGDAGPVLFNLIYRNGHVHNKLSVGKNETHIKNVNHFEVRDPQTRELVFSTTKPRFNIPAGVKNLKAHAITASRITSALKDNLQIQTRGKLVLSGAEGVTLEAKSQLWSADQNIILKSINGSIVLGGAKGTFIDPARVPIVQLENGVRSAELQYKLCVCMPEGKLFRVPRGILGSKITCAHFSSEFNPCE